LASRAKATTPAAIGADADVPGSVAQTKESTSITETSEPGVEVSIAAHFFTGGRSLDKGKESNLLINQLLEIKLELPAVRCIGNRNCLD
jgi:hypothetical protein